MLNTDVSFTWLGHGAWRVRSAKGKELLIDPWVRGPTVPDDLRKVERCDILALTHGHGDHTGDALEIATRLKPTIVTTFEIANWFERNGVSGALGGAQGGTIEAGGIQFLLVHAQHSSSFDMEGGAYAGNPVGFVITFENGFKIYFSGDTDVFGDMALIRELEQPDAAFLSIGDFFTMGPERAAKAVELLGVKTVVPMHFGTFPVLVGRPSQLQELVGGGVTVLDIKPGDTI